MADLQVGDKVRVTMPRGYSKRGVFGVSVMFTTWPETRFNGATGVITDINPVGPMSLPKYLVNFRLNIPWQAEWFREEWIDLVERPAAAAAQ